MSFLPGWFPGGAVAARIEIQLSHIATSSTLSSGNISHPASGIEAGDLLIYIAEAYEDDNDDPPDVNLPSGYTGIIDSSGTPGGSAGLRVRAGYKIAAGNEDGVGVNISPTGTNDGEAAAIVQFRPTAPIGSVTIVDTDGQNTANNPSAQVQGGAGISVSLHMAFYSAVLSIDPRSYSPAADAETQLTTEGFRVSWIKWTLFNPPSTAEAITVDMGDSGNNSLVSFSLLVEP